MLGGSRNDEEKRRRTREVKGWARELFEAGEEDTVMVTELRCTEPGCPPEETVIALLKVGEKRQAKVHKPLVEVTREDVERAIRGGHA
ncbi:MAG: hypothetical protein MUF64_26960 [Polyangiaceae bacterium]|jgi:hypothetical protein|nr:hypothetical protein [Polyangiaceae bacterium]